LFQDIHSLSPFEFCGTIAAQQYRSLPLQRAANRAARDKRRAIDGGVRDPKSQRFTRAMNACRRQ
jgi:hypothetical protein